MTQLKLSGKLPLWALPASMGLGAAGGVAVDAYRGESPWMGALKGAFLAPAALFGGKAIYEHALKNPTATKDWKPMFGNAQGAAREKAYHAAMKRRAYMHGAAGGAGVGAGTYGVGRAAFGDFIPDRQQQPEQPMAAELAHQQYYGMMPDEMPYY